MRVKDVKDRLVIFIFLLGYVSGVTLRHKHSKVGLKRHMRREMELGVRYTNLPFVSYEAQNNSVVEAQVGGSASLKCFTENLGEELVTWLKRDDEQLLTAGPQVYSSENRYSVSHMKHQKLWELRIRDVRMSDRGLYECQLTTHPPISILIDLKVVEARAVIRGPKDVHVHEGSRLRLVCHVKEATELPLYVFWFHNGSMVNYEARRPLTVTKQRFVSALIISNVSRSDAGSYRCEPSNAKSDNITLHVVADENSAAMQRGLEKKKLRDQNVSSIPILKTSSNSAEEATSFSCLIFFLVCFVHTLSAVSHGNVTETALEILRRAFSRLTNAGGVRADRWRKSGIVPPNVKMKKKRTSPPVRSRCLFTRGKTIVWVVWAS